MNREELAALREAAAAYPFVDDAWENSYTRETGIKWVHYDKKSNFGPSWPLKNNFGFFLSEIFTWRKRDWERQISKKPWWLPRPWHALTWLKFTQTHRPDGSLNEGCIVTYWEEAGVFIEKFPPSVVLGLIELAEIGLDIREMEQAQADYDGDPELQQTLSDAAASPTVRKSRVSSLSEAERQKLADAPIPRNYISGGPGEGRLT